MGNFADLCIAHSSKSRSRNLTMNSTESGCISDVLAHDLILAEIIHLSTTNYVTLKTAQFRSNFEVLQKNLET